MNPTKHAIVRSDGGARGNPGPAGLGAVVEIDGQVVEEISEYLGETTNNQAEYQAIHAGLKAAKSLGATSIECVLDSELIVKQIKGEYKVKNKELQPWFLKVWNLYNEFSPRSVRHVPRAENKHADKLVNQAIDRGIAATAK